MNGLMSAAARRACEADGKSSFELDPESLLRQSTTLYVVSSGDSQEIMAPIVCGMIEALRRARYGMTLRGERCAPVLFALDELANIAPLHSLPNILAEGASQGVIVCAALQDLSQARMRYHEVADGFLTLFSNVVVLRGVRDDRTVEQVSKLFGERVVHRVSTSQGASGKQSSWSRGTSEQLERVVRYETIASGFDETTAWVLPPGGMSPFASQIAHHTEIAALWGEPPAEDEAPVSIAAVRLPALDEPMTLDPVLIS
jgi:hypothetical protein